MQAHMTRGAHHRPSPAWSSSMNPADSAYDQLRMNYAQSLARKYEDLAQAWECFSRMPGDADACRGLHAQIHRLTGSAPSYGYANLGALARELDELMSQMDACDALPVGCASRLEAPTKALLAALVAAAALAPKDLPAIP